MNRRASVLLTVREGFPGSLASLSSSEESDLR